MGADGGDEVVGGDAALAAAHFGDDAVGADLVAAFLDFEHSPAAAEDAGGGRIAGGVDRGSDIRIRIRVHVAGAGGQGWAGAALPGQFGEGQGDQLGFVLVAGDEGNFGHPAEFGGGALGVAPGGDDDGLRVLAAGGAQGLAGFGVSGGGYGAGVDDDDVGVGRGVHQAAAGLDELTGQDGAVGLIELAAVGFNGNGADADAVADGWRGSGSVKGVRHRVVEHGQRERKGRRSGSGHSVSQAERRLPGGGDAVAAVV